MTFGELKEFIPTLPIWKRRRDKLCSKLEKFSRWASEDVDIVPANAFEAARLCDQIRQNATPENFREAARLHSGILACLRRAGLMPPRTVVRDTPEVREVRRVVGKAVFRKVVRFVTWCSYNGIAFSSVNSKTFDLFKVHLETASIDGNQHQLVREAISGWNTYVERSEKGDLVAVSMPLLRLRNRRVPLTAFADEVNVSLNAYCDFCGCDEPLNPLAIRRPLARRTIDHRKNLIHYALDTLVKDGMAPEDIRKLEMLFERDIFFRLCRALDGRADTNPKARSYAHFTVTALFALGEWLKIPDEHRSMLRKTIASKMQPPRLRMTVGNWTLVRSLMDDTAKEALVTAPSAIIADALAHTDSRQLRLSQAQAAVALSTVSHLPLRLHNLATLRFNHSLFVEGAGFDVRIPGIETKDGSAVEYDVPAPVADILKIYRNEILAPLFATIPDWLFVNLDGSRKTDSHLRYLIKRYSRIFMGKKVRPHVFRHFWAALILDENPGAYEMVQNFLNHRYLEGTRRYYADVDSLRASRLHGELLETAIDSTTSSGGLTR
jgi:integrase